MGIDITGYQIRAREAVKAFWGNREAARLKQLESGKTDQGERAGVTGGKNMDGFLALAENIVRKNGLKAAEICYKGRLVTLPGYFRPTKKWDMLVMNKGRLVAAIEFKSQVGPSFGKNFNNRTEEALGSAVDLWTAFREGALGDNPRPFVGWLMLVEDCKNSRAPILNNISPHFPIFSEFENTSIVNRYTILCRKLVQESLYSATALLISKRSAIDTGEYSELSKMSGLKAFISVLAGHVAAEVVRGE